MVAELLSGSVITVPAATLSTTVRSEAQVQSLSKLGIKVLQIDLSDEASVVDAILHNES